MGADAAFMLGLVLGGFFGAIIAMILCGVFTSDASLSDFRPTDPEKKP